MIPQDPVLLLSYLNTKLRDEYPSLEAFCEDNELEAEPIKKKLASIGYAYRREENKFIPQ